MKKIIVTAEEMQAAIIAELEGNGEPGRGPTIITDQDETLKFLEWMNEHLPELKALARKNTSEDGI